MKFGKVYNGVAKVKDMQKGSIKNLRDVALEEQKRKRLETK